MNTGRKLGKLVIAGLLIVSFVGCASHAKPLNGSAESREAKVEVAPTKQVVLDWSDRSMGQESAPVWLKPLVINKNDKPFKDAMGIGANDIVKFNVATNIKRNTAMTIADVQFAVNLARELKTNVLAEAANALDPDTGEFDVVNVATTRTKVTLTGWNRAADFWQEIETVNPATNEKSRVFQYYIVYTTSADIWDKLVAKYLLDVVGQLPEKKTQQTMAKLLNELQNDTRKEEARSDAQFRAELEAQQLALKTVTNAVDRQAALKTGDPAKIAAAATTPDDGDYLAALALAAGVLN
jgi:hypothetical protein